ncbi:TIGR03643 family protein [Synechococcus sp. MIT S1220]|uniref:TIGR03643 family protein n=1 Tax=Synechococcus sp. MIT S1220 TaxID=3082549 RepID=UPI0039B08E7A
MNSLEPDQINRIIEMAWEDRTTFEAIEFQFGLKDKDVIAIMRQNMKSSSFKMWRKRVSGRKTKHQATSNSKRFKAKCHK